MTYYFIFIWFIPMSFYVSDKGTLIRSETFIIFLLQGGLISFVRLKDSYFRFRLKVLMKQMMRRANKEELDKIKVAEAQQHEDWEFSLNQVVNQGQTEQIIRAILEAVQISLCNQHQKNPYQENLLLSEKQIQKEKLQLDLTAGSTTQNDERLTPLMKNSKIQAVVELFAPDIFLKLRLNDGIDDSYIRETLSLNLNGDAIKKTQESMGRSGSFFFFSQNKKLILKTINEEEKKTLINTLLKKYFDFIQENPQSTLSRIYGAFTINIESFNRLSLILIENTLEDIEQIQGALTLYDLKGSLKNRFTKNTDGVMKDLNFLASNHLFLEMSTEIRTQLIRQIYKDSKFLRAVGLMDYSMLLGIKKLEGQTYKNQNKEKLGQKYFRNIEGFDYQFSVSIIDFLQQFNLRKKLETYFKSISTEKRMISSVEPTFYQLRFYTFMQQIIAAREYH